jgi:hypothetical protein
VDNRKHIIPETFFEKNGKPWWRGVVVIVSANRI